MQLNGIDQHIVLSPYLLENGSQNKNSPTIARQDMTEMVRGIFILSLSRQRIQKQVVSRYDDLTQFAF